MKFKSNQSGYVALLVTSILLLLALIVVLASSKGIFFQIKVAQNELRARQAHWKAEGGLECAFSKAKLEKQIPATVDDCKTAMELIGLTFSAGDVSVVTSELENARLRKTIKFPAVGGTGAIKSTSDLVINGAYTSSADPGKSRKEFMGMHVGSLLQLLLCYKCEHTSSLSNISKTLRKIS